MKLVNILLGFFFFVIASLFTSPEPTLAAPGCAFGSNPAQPWDNSTSVVSFQIGGSGILTDGESYWVLNTWGFISSQTVGTRTAGDPAVASGPYPGLLDFNISDYSPGSTEFVNLVALGDHILHVYKVGAGIELCTYSYTIATCGSCSYPEVAPAGACPSGTWLVPGKSPSGCTGDSCPDCAYVSGCTLAPICTGKFGENPCDPRPGGYCPTAIGNIPINPAAFANRILQIGLGIAGGIALILMVIGSVRVLTSSGDQQKLNGGRDMIIAAVSGLLFLIFSVLILKFVGVDIIGIPGLVPTSGP